jgi:hypothetical protein
MNILSWTKGNLSRVNANLQPAHIYKCRERRLLMRKGLISMRKGLVFMREEFI